jgi:penicillin-binding protein 1C
VIARGWKAALLAGLGALGAALIAASLPPLELHALGGAAASGALLDRHGEVLHAALSRDEAWCFPRPLDAFSPHLINATIAAEDQRFRTHAGVDAIAVARAAWGRLSGGARSGASTLTMQAINLGGNRSRDVGGKLRQTLGALRLERAVSKDDILAFYLNRAPYGFNLVGAEAAAQRYFDKPAAELTLPEAALLAALPRAPSRYQPLRDPDRARARRAYVLRRMEAEGMIAARERQEAEAAPLGAAWHELPRLAPHLAAAMADETRNGGTVRLTLDKPLQERCEQMLAKYLHRYNGDITNAAAMIVDAATGEVLARVGSAGFHTVPGGQVDAVSAPRSPGSALKPFAYALGIERGLLYPTEKLLDDSIDFGSYAPENFDGIFNGLVSASQALQLSLNVPAVAALDRVGLADMQAFLQHAGISTLTHAPAHYGLGLALGNCGVRLDELCGAYAMLANEGRHRPLRLRADAPHAPERALLRPDTALAVFRMLEQPFPKEPPGGLVRGSGTTPRACWKTGTSTGFHDAWTIAFNRQYVVGVWVGNSGGQPSPRLVGALAALPLAASIFRALPASSAPAWPDTAGLEQPAQVCAVTGLPASPWCDAAETAVLPAGQFLNRRCDAHYPDADGRTRLRWPASARHWDLARIGDTVESDDATADAAPNRALRITAPADGAHYILSHEPGGDRVLLRSSIDGDAPLHWYQNGRYLGTSDRHTPLHLALEPGEHTLACMAPAGLTDSIRYAVAP